MPKRKCSPSRHIKPERSVDPSSNPYLSPVSNKRILQYSWLIHLAYKAKKSRFDSFYGCIFNLVIGIDIPRVM